jgi:hypothetical protein
MRATEASRFLDVRHSEELDERRRTFHWAEPWSRMKRFQPSIHNLQESQ